MKYLPYILISLALFFCGCAKSNSDARSMDEFRASVESMPELLALDEELSQLEEETSSLEDDYNILQSQVLPHVQLESDTDIRADQLKVYINENSVMIVNDATMSKNDFSSYVDRVLPALCTPTPRLSIHKKADYDTAAWVLDAIYSRGCSNVNVE